MLIAVNYHYVRPSYDAPYPGIHGTTPERLESQLALLDELGTFVSAKTVRAALRGDAELPERAIAITFDDGLREQYLHARPVLERLGVPAIYFINTGPIAHGTVSTVHKIHQLRSQVEPGELAARISALSETRAASLRQPMDPDKAVAQYRYDTPAIAALKYRLNFCLERGDRDAIIGTLFAEVFADEKRVSEELYMSPAQIAELGSDELVGSHGDEHDPLSQLPVDRLRGNLERSALRLQEMIGYRPYAFSYPYGGRPAVDTAVAARAAEHSFELAFTTERAANRTLERPLLLARYDNNDVPGGKACALSPAEMLDSLSYSTWFS